MKRVKRILSMVLVLAFALSIGVISASADDGRDFLDGYRLAYSDGDIKIWVKTEAAPLTRAGYTYEGVASPTAYHSYICEPEDGNFCRIEINNLETDEIMAVTNEYDVGRDEPISLTEYVDPGDRCLVIIENENGGIDYRVNSIIEAYHTSSVAYSYSAEQFWSA